MSDEGRPRWDPDERGIGVGAARGHLATLDAMRAVADRDGWVAESPETHLLPRLTEHLAGRPLAIDATRTGPDGTFEVDARWVGPADPEAWRVRAAAISLIGVVAETGTLIRETRGPDGEARFAVMTGLLPGDTRFATHGHSLVLRVRLRADTPGDTTDAGA
ncbi:MAG TPA: hypothetical protein VGQ31_03385 [Candidatus Limnocylindrales bacterium]|nr:hypothetical protein [Candidatus Limnocylindrales bacterium]